MPAANFVPKMVDVAESEVKLTKCLMPEPLPNEQHRVTNTLKLRRAGSLDCSQHAQARRGGRFLRSAIGVKSARSGGTKAA
jgi:hypothetical protein